MVVEVPLFEGKVVKKTEGLFRGKEKSVRNFAQQCVPLDNCPDPGVSIAVWNCQRPRNACMM